MSGLGISFGAEEIEQLAGRVVSRVKDDLEERLADLVKQHVEEALDQSAIWVPRQLTNEQLAHILQIPESRARTMTSEGNIPRINLSSDSGGKSYRVDPRDLNLWLDAHQDFPARRDELRQILEEGKMLMNTR